MERIKLQELKNWLVSDYRKPLVVWGARQVGKSYLIKELFASDKSLFDDYVYIDLKKDKDAREFFATTSNATDYLQYIEARFGKKISPKVPLIFDEVQQCHQVLSALKYFKQDYPELPVIATGSMVRLSLKHDEGKNDEFLFPVGAINEINIFPLNFEEYLLNTNKVLLDRIKNAYNDKKPLEHYEHELALDALYTFLTIGGLPEALKIFIKDNSYVNATIAIKSIYNNYLSDMDTYNVSTETILKTKRVYKNIFTQLNKENKNFKINQIETGKSNRDYFNAYQWLELARVVYRTRKKSGKITLPLIEEDEGLFRLYLSDAGMFTYQSGINQSEFFVKEKRNTLSGIFYENYVADEFAAKEIPLFYWTGTNSNEFEFVVQNNGKVLPIDVKKSKGTLNSLKVFRNFNPKSTAIKISSNNFGYDQENDILTIPLYEVFLLADDVANNRRLI